MPLPDSVEREELHFRRIELKGYRRHDGLYDIEGRIVDTRTYPFKLQAGLLPPGEALHEMWVRIVVDAELLVHDITAVTDASPYRVCREAADRMSMLKGLRIGKGWTQAVNERLRGVAGCTHLRELMGPLATVAIQTLSQFRFKEMEEKYPANRPGLIDSCHAYSSGGDVVRERWPTYFIEKSRE
jgi:hypothetical protein